MENYSVQNYIDDIRDIVAKETDEGPITDMIKPLSVRLAANPAWLKDAFRKVDHEQGFGIHLLHEEKDHNLAVFVIAWAPGRGLAAHNHSVWNNGNEIAISLHTYGRHLNHTGRSIFDVEKKLETPCIVNVQE